MLFGQRPKILIIDDVPDNVELLGAALDDFCDVRFALSGADGLAMLDSYLPNLILLDVMMPGMDGYEVCDLLKHESRTRGIPVIFVTARTDPASETRALMGGGADFIHKPFNRDTVRVRVRTQLELKARELECRQARDDLSFQVVERTRALEDALAQAEAASRAKSNFLANVSHELKTPLNAILGYAFVLARKLDDPVLRERSERIRESGLRLLGVVNNILDASNLTGDGAALEGIDFHLLEMLNLCEEQLIERARSKGLGLAREIDPELPLVLHGDPLRIGQVLGNLLDNAVKFSEQGCITLRVRRKVEDGMGLMVRFEVEDQGVGIPAGSREMIFEDFRQLDDSSTRRFGGCGLGLSICRQLVNRMRGSIGLEAAPGGGSVFWFQVPLAPAQFEAGPQLTLAYLRRLLETESLMARTLWAQCRPVLLPLLGQDGALLEQALEQAELSRALELLVQPMRGGHE